MPLRRVHATEGDDGAALELNAVKADVLELRTRLLAIGTKLDADVLTDNDYNATIAADLTAVTSATLVRGNQANGTEVGDSLDLDGARVYTARTDGALVREHNTNHADAEVVRAAFENLLEKLDLDGTVTDVNYETLWLVVALSATTLASGEQLAGEPAQLNAAGARVHSSDADDGLMIEIENLAADVTSLRTNIIGMLAKLDDDGGVPETDYEALQTPAAQTSFGTRRASAATVAGIPGSTGPVVTTNPAGDPAF